MEQEFFSNFYNKLRDENIDEEFIESIDELIKKEEFTQENFKELIEEAFYGK